MILSDIRSFQGEEVLKVGVFQDTLEKISWHYHNNYELSFITEGKGKRIVGDSLEGFQPGDLVFLGPGLPHVWIAEKEPHPSNRSLEMVYMQFDSRILPAQLLSLPGMDNPGRAIGLAERGLVVEGQSLNEVSEIMLQMPYLGQLERLLSFFRIMDIIGKIKEPLFLASREYILTRLKPSNRRIETIHNYLMNNFGNEIRLRDLAELVNMAEGSLCRFFRMNTGMTLFEYINRIKIDLSCKLLMDKDLPVIEVCMESGFHNLSHFNKQFRDITGMTPSLYRKTFTLHTPPGTV
jgi:AraC-like DNA-binding protein